MESDCVGIGCMVSPQYTRFQKLKEKLSDKELIELSKHENPTIRTYASIELIQSEKVYVSEILSTELQKNEEVETFKGCIMDIEPISSIIYQEYSNKIRIEASRKIRGNNYEEDLAMKKALATDLTMQKLDSVIIYSISDVNWLIYKWSFENRKYNNNYLPRIKELAFEENNGYAFNYLMRYYSSECAEELDNYLKADFPKAIFQTENEIFYLHSYIEVLLASKDEELIKIALHKLKTNQAWKDRKDWFNSTLNKYGVIL